MGKHILNNHILALFSAVAFFVLGKRLGTLSPEGPLEEYKKFIASAKDFPKATQDIMFNLPIYKIFPTKAWRRLVEAQDEVSVTC